MPRLFVLSGDDLGKTHDVERDVVLGRGEEADIRIRAVSVSRTHARIERDASGLGWRVVDLASRNGLKVDGERVEAAPLTDGMVFVLGDVELRFRADMAAPGTAPPVVPVVAIERIPPPKSAPGPPLRLPPPSDVADETQLEDEIQLEGEWDDTRRPAPPPVRQPERAPQPSASPASAGGGGGAAPGARAGADRDARRAELLRKGGGASAAAGAAVSGGKPVLQYHRTEGAGGVFGADLAQQPWWVRLGVWVLALALLVGIAFGALELTRKLRASEATLSTPIEDGADR